MFYFGYGSNLSPTYMAIRCPSSIYLCPAFLAGYTWIIGENGYATIHSTPPSKEKEENKTIGSPSSINKVKVLSTSNEEKQGVWGSLYSVTAEDIESLDIQENIPFSYQKTLVSVSVAGGTKDQVLVYTNESRRRRGRIGMRYAQRINTGIREAGLPESYVLDVLRVWVPPEEEEGDEDEEVKEVQEIQRARFGVDARLLEGKLEGLLRFENLVDRNSRTEDD